MARLNSIRPDSEPARHEASHWLKRAERCRANREYDDATEALLAALESEVTAEEKRRALFGLAELSFERGDLHQALGYWDRAIASGSGGLDASACELHGTILLHLYRNADFENRDSALLDRAVHSYERAVRLDPEPDTLARIYLGLGRTCVHRGLVDRAVEYFERVVAQAPKDKEVLAECYHELGQIEAWDHDQPARALPLFQLALDTSSEESSSNWLAHVYWHLGHALVQMGKPEEALVMGARALEVMDPDHVDYPHELLAAHRLLGWAYYNIPGREDQAIEHYRQALDLEEDAPTYLYLGRLYFAKEEFGQALAMFQSAVFAEPCYEHVGDVYYAIGTCLAVLEQYEDALIYLQKAREEQATITFRPFYIYKSLGWSYWHLDRYDEAALAFKTALGLMHPNDRQYREIEHYLREVQAQGVAPFSHGDSG